MRYVVAAWVDKNPGEARQWVESLPTGLHRTYAIQGLVGALAKRDPAAALAFVQNLPPGSRVDGALAYVDKERGGMAPKARGDI